MPEEETAPVYPDKEATTAAGGAATPGDGEQEHLKRFKNLVKYLDRRLFKTLLEPDARQKMEQSLKTGASAEGADFAGSREVLEAVSNEGSSESFSEIAARVTEHVETPGQGNVLDSAPGNGAADEVAESLPCQSPEEHKGKISHLAKHLDPRFFKTALDREALCKMADMALYDRHSRKAEELKNRPVEPFQPQKAVKKYRQAIPCGKGWDTMSCWDTLDGSGGGRVRLCKECKLQIYNLNNMSQEEAEELVFQRENRRWKVVFFKRKDGTFMTSNCPSGVKRQRKYILAASGGVLLAGCILVMAWLAPPQTTSPHAGMDLAHTAHTWNRKKGARQRSMSYGIATAGGPFNFPSPVANLRHQGGMHRPYPSAHNQSPSVNGHIRVQKLTSEPTNLPHLPRYPNMQLTQALRVYGISRSSGYKLRYVVFDKPEKMLNWYENELKGQGYQISSIFKQGSGLTAVLPSANATVYIRIHGVRRSPRGDTCAIEIRYIYE